MLVVAALALSAQTSGTLRGHITDPSGAVVPQATVAVTSSTGHKLTATTSRDGVFELNNIPAGKYAVEAVAKGFSPFRAEIELLAGQVRALDVSLEIAVEQLTVNVEDQNASVEVSSASNASTIVIKGKDLDALSDDPDELQADLEALAGPSAGPNGGQIYIDGFSGGQLPPKSSIREIRINQNPFSAQYDRLGFGRIEVFTKPGKDQFHGQFMTNVNNSVFNSRNPFLHPQPGVEQPGYHSEMYNASLSGPINKKSSFFLNAQRRNINETSIVNATVLDSGFNPVPFNAAVRNPRTRSEISPRIDYQLTNNNTLTVRYELERSTGENNGIGQFSLPEQAFDSSDTEHDLQISDTQVINSSTINETRFQYGRETSRQTARTLTPSIVVLDTFTGGGNSVGRSSDTRDHFEFQNYTSKVHGTHFIRFGGRVRVNRNTDNATSNFNGAFTFTSLYAYQITARGLAEGLTPEQIRATCITDPVSNQPVCGGASQFTMTTGNPLASVSQTDVGLYAEDDWRVRPNLTVSYGLRFETQNNIGDHADFAPRIGFAWGIDRGKNASPKTVLRAGFGMFYDRFNRDLVLQAARLNGINQQRIVVTNPDFYPNLPDASALPADPSYQPAIYRIDSRLRSPYVMQFATTLERQLGTLGTLAVTYLHTRGVHQLVSRNINAPRADGTRPFGEIGNIYQYESAGVFRQNQLITNANIRAGQNFSLFGFYSLSYANGNTSGAGSFPSNPYDLAADYGRTAYDVRHRGVIGGNFGFRYGFRLSPFITASSGRPFNISIGKDLNQDSIFNDRPAFATDLTRPSVVVTRWGAFDTAPFAGQTVIPINYGDGPGQFTVNLRVSKIFGFGRKQESQRADDVPRPGGLGGPRGPGGHDHGPGRGGMRGHGPGPFGGGGSSGQRYTLTFSASARNLLNHVNPANPVGNLSSNRFGESVAIGGMGFFSSAANRRVDFQVMFAF
ncbi:MAG: carboxypeptidase regulatory-like domain-containing protein [Terriglobales bacterium]